MPRTARIVVPTMPHHVIQRGNRRQDVFFEPDDYRTYLRMLREQIDKGGFTLGAYCLMRNHVHLIVIPENEAGLCQIGKVHQRYARYINKKKDWTGYLWQGRFGSYPMDEAYCYEAVRYVETNPVRAGICGVASSYRWSSARQRVGRDSGRDLKVAIMDHLSVNDWPGYWQESVERFEATQAFLVNETRLKPLGKVSLEIPLGTQ